MSAMAEARRGATMSPEQLEAAYAKGRDDQINRNNGDPFNASGRSSSHLAGLAEVARQQAEHDAQIADAEERRANDQGDFGAGAQWGITMVADAIREQFKQR